ncbi:MAG: hypothetical protein ACJ8R9_10780 [Steroidobacteraceae bacterium]
MAGRKKKTNTDLRAELKALDAEITELETVPYSQRSGDQIRHLKERKDYRERKLNRIKTGSWN